MIMIKPNVLIIGFPSIGLVGAFAVAYLVEHMKMKRISEIKFANPVPIYAVHDGKIVGPVQAYKKDNVYAIVSKVPLDLNLAHQFFNSVLDFAKQNDIDEIIIPRGADTGMVKSNKCKVFGLPLNENNLLKKYGIDKLNNSTIYGTDAGVISSLRNKSYDSLMLYTTCNSKVLDSDAVIKSITTLNDILRIKSNTKEIKEKIEQIQKYNKAMIAETKTALNKERTKGGAGTAGIA